MGFSSCIQYRFFKRVLSVCLLVVAPSLVAAPDSTEELPLLELGVGIGGISGPHYLGSDQNYLHLLPLPFVVYRGEHIRADRTGLRAIVVGDQKIELNLSVNAGLPVDSDDNHAREGMPDLDWLLEAGPSLRYTPIETDSGASISVEFPVRAVYALDGAHPRHQGWTATPGVIAKQDFRGWKLTGSALALFADDDYHNYFYGVETPYVTAERPYYRANGGYTGSRLGIAATTRKGDWYFGGFVHVYNLHGSENQDSPLLRDNSNMIAGFMISRILFKSKQTAIQHTEE